MCEPALLCRLCACAAESWLPLFEGEGLLRQIPAKLALLPVEVGQGDALPQVACSECIYQLDTLSQFFERVSTADTRLRELFSTNVLIKVEPVDLLGSELDQESPQSASVGTILPTEETRGSLSNIVPKQETILPSEGNQGPLSNLISLACTTLKQNFDVSLPVLSALGASSSFPAPVPIPRLVKGNSLSPRVRLLLPKPPSPPAGGSSGRRVPAILQRRRQPPPSVRYMCEQCSAVFLSAEEANSHVLTVHSSSRPHSTPSASQVPSSASPLEVTAALSKKPSPLTPQLVELNSAMALGFGCSACQLVFLTREQADAHLSGHAEMLGCEFCSHVFPSVSRLRKHHSSCNRTTPHPPPPWRCDLCGKQSPVRFKVFQHMFKHSELRPYKCSLCPKTFKTREVVLQHETNVHERKANFTCDLCGKSYTVKDSIKLHIESTHMKKRPYQCEICSKAFYAKSALKYHGFQVHSIGSVRTYTCHVCQRPFTNRAAMESHVETHLKSVEERRVHLCPLCGIRSTSKYALKKHIQCHPESGFTRKLHPCHVCGKQLFSAKSLSQHLVLHSGLRSFVCEQCGKAFATGNTLRTHMVTHGGERRYACSECGARLTQRSSLVSHMRKQHGMDARVRRMKNT